MKKLRLNLNLNDFEKVFLRWIIDNRRRIVVIVIVYIFLFFLKDSFNFYLYLDRRAVIISTSLLAIFLLKINTRLIVYLSILITLFAVLMLLLDRVKDAEFFGNITYALLFIVVVKEILSIKGRFTNG